MNDRDKQIISDILKAIERILNAYENYKSIDKIDDTEKKDFLYDIILSNLVLINNLYKNLSPKIIDNIKIDWQLFDFYARELLDTKKEIDNSLIINILEKDLPILQKFLKRA